MNLEKLFETQRALDERIVKEKELDGRDLLPEKILALQVELGELANEWREFKFWSEDREPRTKVLKKPTMNDEDKVYGNPLLEEYVDCLHFILSIGLEKGFEYIKTDLVKSGELIDQFNGVLHHVSYFDQKRTRDSYCDLLKLFCGLGEMLGFTWEEIESAYFAKNEINHARQENNY